MSQRSEANQHIIAHKQRLSQSLLWSLQRNFFDQQGVNAWRNGTVPHYITSNPYVAQAYAQVVFGWLRDVVAISARGETRSLDPNQPIYLMELGAGSGRLAYHFLKAFFDFHEASILKEVPVKYIMTDFSQATLGAWQSHPQLHSWVEAGRLDFARFDAERDQSLTLIQGGETLAAENLKNPLAVIANYFFDSLPQDAFYLEEGQLHESLVTLSLPQLEADLSNPELLQKMKLDYEPCLTSSDYYDDQAFNQILHSYQQTLGQTHLLFPIGALQCLRTLSQLAKGRLMLISGDKGYHREIDLLSRNEPKLAMHGSFSMMVNYHALGQYILNQGGQFLTTPHRHTSLDICVALLGQPPGDYPETRQAYTLAVEKGGPDDFYTLKKGVEKHYQDFELPQLLAYLRLSGWDSTIFLSCFPALLERLADSSKKLHEELYWAIHQVWETYYHLGEERDLPFALAMLLYGMGYYPEAIEFLQHSLRLHGPDVATLYNLAMCHYELRQLDTALTYVNQTLEADSTFEPAQAMRLKLQTELRRRR